MLTSCWVALASIMVLSPASALQLKKIGKKAEKYAYVSVWMKRSETPQEKLTEAMSEQEEEDYKKVHFNFASKVEEELAIPPGGSKMYGPEMIFKIDDSMRKYGTKHPYVIITNDPALIKSEKLKEHPDIIIVDVGHDVEFIRMKQKVAIRNQMHVQKLSVFNMTQYDKVISLDMDIKVNKNLDHVFAEYDTEDGKQIWGMLNEFECKGGVPKHLEGDYFNSAVMLLQPKPEIFSGLMEFAHQRGGFWGDQAMMQNFFRSKSGANRQPKLFPRTVANFVDCKDQMNKHPPDVVHLR